MKNYVEIGKKGVNDHTENTRLDIELSKSDSSVYKSVNYRKIVALKNGYSNIDSLEFEDPHDRFKDYEEESYIDNSELLRDTYPPGQEPENVGFFINFGKLKLKPKPPKSVGCSPKTPTYKKKKHHNGDKDRKRNKSGLKHSKASRTLDTSPVTPVRLSAETVPKISITVSSPAVVSEPKKVSKSESKHHHLHHRDKAEKKKLKLILKEEKKARKSVDGVKSPKSKKKVDHNVVLDKILMSRAKEVKSSQGRIVPPSPSYIMLPGFDGGIFPCYSINP